MLKMINLGAITLATAKVLSRFQGKMSKALAVISLALAGLLAYKGETDLAMEIGGGALVALGLIEAGVVKELKDAAKAEATKNEEKPKEQ